jgi:hypothetical protein
MVVKRFALRQLTTPKKTIEPNLADSIRQDINKYSKNWNVIFDIRLERILKSIPQEVFDSFQRSIRSCEGLRSEKPRFAYEIRKC